MFNPDVSVGFCWLLLTILIFIVHQESIAPHLSSGVRLGHELFDFFQHDLCFKFPEANTHDHGQIASNSMLDLSQGSIKIRHALMIPHAATTSMYLVECPGLIGASEMLGGSKDSRAPGLAQTVLSMSA